MPACTLTCPARLEHLESVTAFVEETAEQFELELKKKFQVLIAVEEAFVNVCHYAYPDGEGQVELACGLDGQGWFFVELADSGVPFNVLTLPEPDTTSDLMERQIGGLGVHFIRSLTEQVSYRYTDGKNILRMLFQHSGDAA